MRQSASNGVPGRGGIFVPGGTGYRVAAGFERTAGSPAGRDGERRDLGSRFLSSAPPAPSSAGLAAHAEARAAGSI